MFVDLHLAFCAYIFCSTVSPLWPDHNSVPQDVPQSSLSQMLYWVNLTYFFTGSCLSCLLAPLRSLFFFLALTSTFQWYLRFINLWCLFVSSVLNHQKRAAYFSGPVKQYLFMLFNNLLLSYNKISFLNNLFFNFLKSSLFSQNCT